MIDPRIRAQWRQIDREHDEAVVIRRKWMTVLGCDAEEIEDVIATSFDLSLAEELKDLAAANQMAAERAAGASIP